MCGIAGVADLEGVRPFPPGALREMANALRHRGPDQDGYLDRPGLALASRRLSIVGLSDGRQPIANEDRSVHVVFNGELFDYPEVKEQLERRGHRFATRCDTELLPHLWEEQHERMFEGLRGQFAFALWDQSRRLLILVRDRMGICPLYWTVQHTNAGSWLLFASEIKALLSSGLVDPRPDLRGIDHALTFFALPGPVTCFEGVQALQPGHYLAVQLGRPGKPASISDRTYWEIDFPDRGDEEPGQETSTLIDRYEGLAMKAVERRLRADVPVVSYLSGGVDSSLVLALASHIRRQPPPTFTIQVQSAGFDETSKAAETARHLSTRPIVVPCDMESILAAYPSLIEAAECPVSDTCCSALLLLAREVHREGFKVALTGEGADETLAGYPWFKLHKLMSFLDVIPGFPVSDLIRQASLRVVGAPRFSWSDARRMKEAVGGQNAWLDLYGLIGVPKRHFYSPAVREELGTYVPYADLGLNVERLRRWHPLNQSLYLGLRIHLPGLLLSIGGDRVAMHSAVETRYPFLDEDLVDFLAGLHPRWKLPAFKDKYILRLLAERWLPPSVAWRPKTMFQAPFDVVNAAYAPAYVDQLLSRWALNRTPYFDVDTVQHWRQKLTRVSRRLPQHALMEHGLAGVVMTQLWHHVFMEDLGVDVPMYRPQRASAA